MKLTSGTKEQFPTRMAQVVNGLREEALAIAMKITQPRLMKAPTSLPDKFHSSKQSEASDSDQDGSQGASASMRPSTLPPQGFLTDGDDDEDGMELLFKEMKQMVFPQTTHESRAVYKEYTKTIGGIFCRQSGEAMHLYVARRKAAWRRIRELDDKTMLSSEMRADMLLEAANISKAQQQMVISSIGNDRDYDKIAAALIFQHPTIHASETPTRPHTAAKTYSPGGKSPYKKPPHHMHKKKAWVKKTANLVDGEQAEVWQEVWIADEEGFPEVPAWPEGEDQDEDASAYFGDCPDWNEEDAEAYFTDFGAKGAALAEELLEDIDALEVYELNCY